MRQLLQRASIGLSTATMSAIVAASATPIVTHAKTTLQTNGAIRGRLTTGDGARQLAAKAKALRETQHDNGEAGGKAP
jgi:hypothetical protein